LGRGGREWASAILVQVWPQRRLVAVMVSQEVVSVSQESVSQQPSGSATLVELHKIWVSATADSISHDLDRATQLAEEAPANEREEAARYVAALWRLERWLHDR